MTGQTTRFFYAHPKSMQDYEIDEALAGITRALTDAIAPRVPIVVAGRDDFKQRSRAVGGWKGWSRSVAIGRDIEGAPLFDGYIVPPGPMGRATGEILEQVLLEGKPIMQWSADTGFRRVGRVLAENTNDWRGGWVAVPMKA